jgi:thiamine-monophosphate kinase
MGEFDLIQRWFSALGARREDVVLGVGDDAAVLELPPGQQLVAAVDTLVAGRHFPPGSPPRSVGHRALAVNLSDLAAMGAEPRYTLLALTLPQADDAWLQEFAGGFGALAQQYGVALIGGDTTSGPLTISVTVLGTVLPGRALTRSGARPGDLVFVSGTPGDAAAGLPLADRPAPPAALRARFEYPTPRVALGRALAGVASACIDVSDGLAGDLGKLGAASGCAIEIEPALLPLSDALRALHALPRAQELALTGGDDYELAFTVPAAAMDLAEIARAAQTRITRIGLVVPGAGVWRRDGALVTQVAHRGFDHFGP